MKKIISFFLILILFMPLLALADLEVHFLDIGQGDCSIVLCDGKSMVIDGGPGSANEKVYTYIRRALKLRHIDYVVSTHPHVDHVHGLATVLNVAQVDLVLTPVLEWDSRAFRNMLKYAVKQGTPVVVPNEGDGILNQIVFSDIMQMTEGGE